MDELGDRLEDLGIEIGVCNDHLRFQFLIDVSCLI